MDAADWDTRYADSDQMWSLEPNRFVAAELADLAPGRALDLACGEGRNALWLASRGWQVTAMDFSAQAITRGRARDQAGDVTWVVADVLTAPLPRVDLVVLSYLQVAAEQRRTALRHGFDALADGGTLFVVAHDSQNLTHGTGGPQDAAVLYSAEDVLADLRGQALSVQRAEQVSRVVTDQADPHNGQPSRVALDALVRLTKG